MNRSLRTALGSAVVAFATASAAPASVVVIHPTGTPADLTNVAAAIASASDGDIILLRAFDENGDRTNFDLSGMTGGEIVVTAPNVTVSGESDLRTRRVRTTIDGPGTFDLNASLVAFDVQPSADGFMVTGMIFRNFEAVMLLRAGAKNVSFVEGGVVNCANGVFGVGDNDGLVVESVTMRIVATPVGGNAGVTVQEGSDDVKVMNCTMNGPGTGLASLACAGIIDFNISTPASRLIAFGNTVKRFDIGIFVSSACPRILRNFVAACIDGIQAVSEIGTGSTQGTQMVTNALVRNTASRINLDDGIQFMGVESALVAFCNLRPNSDAGLACESSSLSSLTTGVSEVGNWGTSTCGALVSETRAARPCPAKPIVP